MTTQPSPEASAPQEWLPVSGLLSNNDLYLRPPEGLSIMERMELKYGEGNVRFVPNDPEAETAIRAKQADATEAANIRLTKSLFSEPLGEIDRTPTRHTFMQFGRIMARGVDPETE